jgi:hypothetical protein
MNTSMISQFLLVGTLRKLLTMILNYNVHILHIPRFD